MPEITIKPITDANRQAALRLAVAPAQQRHIETTQECLDEAATSPRWRPVGIYADDALVGFAMYGQFPAWIGEDTAQQVWLDRLLIDACYQGHGYGEAALTLLLARLEAEYGTNRIYLSVYGDNDRAIAMYEKHGFAFTGTFDTKGEKVMLREIRA